MSPLPDGPVSVYFNQHQPQPDVPRVQITPDASVVVHLDAGFDQDGDPLYVKWGAPPPWVSRSDGGGPHGDWVTLSLIGAPPGDGGASCLGVDAGTVPFTISDGYHHVSSEVPLVIPGAGQVARPVISGPQPAPTGGAQVVYASSPGDGGCQPAAYRWTDTLDAGVQRGNQLTLTTPSHWCDTTTGWVTLTATAVDATDAGASTNLTVFLDSWGLPNVPTITGGTQRAGTTQTWPTSNSAHTCEGQPGNFPGTDLVVVGGSATGITVSAGDGGVRIASQDACDQRRVDATVSRLVRGGPPSGTSSFSVQLEPQKDPLAPGSFSLDASYVAGQVTVVLNTDAGCAHLRGLSADVRVRRAGGPEVLGFDASVPSTSVANLAEGCNGGDYLVQATLLEDGGSTGISASGTFRTGRLQATVGALSPESLSVTCGEPVDAILQVSPGFCTSAAVSWRYATGPLLSTLDTDGGVARLVTASSSFDLVGERLDLDITADAGLGNSETVRRSLLLTTEPFLRLSHRFGPVPLRGTEAVDVTVNLLNPTSCTVSDLLLREELVDLLPIPGSARLDGTPVTATYGAAELTIGSLELPARTTRALTYRAWPRLLARPKVTGQVTLRGVLVSAEAHDPPISSCGCSTGSAGVLGLLGLAWLLRRRASRRTHT